MGSRLASASIMSCLMFLGLNSNDARAGGLLKNDSFEKPIVSDGSYMLFSNGEKFSGWAVAGDPGNVAIVSGNFTQNGFTFPARKGGQFLDLTGISNTETGVAQTVSTTPGQHYQLTFFVGNVYDPGGIFGTTSTVNVQVDGAQVLSATNRRGQGTHIMEWKKFAITIMATSDKTTIALLNGDPPSDTANALDAVNLVPVP